MLYFCMTVFIFIEIGEKGQKRLIPGCLPTEYLPKKCIESRKVLPRRTLVRDSSETETTLDVYKYTELSDLKKDFKHIKAPWTVLIENNLSCIFGYLAENGNIIHKVTVNEALEFSVESSSLYLPDNHKIYEKYKRSVAKVRIQWLLMEIKQLTLCSGIRDSDLVKSNADIEKGFLYSMDYGTANRNAENTSCIRSCDCEILLADTIGEECCKYCKQAGVKLERKAKSTDITVEKELHPNTPLSTVSKDKLIKEVKNTRKKEKQLRKMVNNLEEEIQQKGTCLNDGLHNDFSSIISGIEKELPDDSFEKLFWQEQKKSFQKNPKAVRWHPMMIRFALHIHLRSPSAYKALRESNVVKLPCERTLRDYTNTVHPSTGFHKAVFDDLKHQVEKLNDIQKYVVLMLDEVSIKDDLVYDKVTGELVGFVNIGNDVDDCHVIRNKEESIKTANVATHALVFMVTSIASRLKFSLGYFATTTATADQLFLLMWKAVGLLETYAGLKVVVVVSDKAGPNQRLYSLHDSGDKITYRTKNVFATDEQRYIYFFSDPPHLIKTARNNLANSGSGSNTRRLWNNGKHLLWKHIVDLYEADRKNMVRTMPKLTNEHVYLTSYSKMRVNLATQVLSETVSNIMMAYSSSETQETATFLLMMDKFFDCCNSRPEMSGQKRKPFLAPYTSVNDSRFNFLKETFLNYLANWKASIDERKGNFTKDDKSKMFLSSQTYQGIVHDL